MLRALLMVVLAAVMVVTSGPMAVARATPEGAIIVICTGDGVETLRLGADGAPLEPAPHCPDCLATGPGLLTKMSGVNLVAAELRPVKAVNASVAWRSAVQKHGTARGPPALRRD